jgi:hypothetical protein
MNNAWPWMAMNNGGFGGLGNGLGAGVVGFILGALINGNGNGLFGNGGNNAGAAAASLGAQATALNNTDLLMNAITSSGERQHEAVQTLSTMLGQDFNLVNSGIQTVQTSLATIAANQGMNVMQVINAIQSGNTSLQNQLCQCCCDMRQTVTNQGYENQLRTVEQTNTLGNIINSNGQRNVDAIADLKTSMISEFCAARERDMQAKIDTQAEIITQLRNAADNANQTNQIAAMIAPLQAKLVAIENRQPNTVSVQYPNLVAMNATPYAGGFYGNGWGNGLYF